MERVQVNGTRLSVQTFGNPSDPAVLLIAVSMLDWPDELCAMLGERYVIRYDLRDVGGSTYVDPGVPGYDLRDLVADAAGLVRWSGATRAHVVGLGVGGFIAQLLALDHPELVATLTLVSTRPVAPGPVDPDLPDHDSAMMEQLFSAAEPDWTDRAEVVEYMVGHARLLAGPRGVDDTDVRAGAGARFDRAGDTSAAQRASHLGTVFAALDCRPRWRERLGELTAPTLVIHGDADPFFPHGNALALVREIPDASLVTLHGVGQGLPRPIWPTVVTAFLRHTGGS